MKRLLGPLAFTIAFVCASAAIAAPYAMISFAQWFKGGVYVGLLANASTNNKLTKSVASGAITYDCADTLTATCTDSSGQTVTGAAVGDTCEIGPNATAGALSGTWTCYVSAANTVVIKFCNPTAGSINPASGSFRVRTLSNQ